MLTQTCGGDDEDDEGYEGYQGASHQSTHNHYPQKQNNEYL